MSPGQRSYCIDTNVLIQAWQKYYSPSICPTYWHILNKLGEEKKIFISEVVKKEIIRTDDDLAAWVKSCKIPVMPIDLEVIECYKRILQADPKHKFLVDSTKHRSEADPWIIAHALKERATVVTKEEKVTAVNSDKIKIPNVCETMGITCINDFDLLSDLGISFVCAYP